MQWNWEQLGWPDFAWDAERLVAAEQAFLLGTGLLLGMTRHLDPEDRDQLTVESLSSEALTTSEIEGEILDRSSVRSSIERQLGFGTDRRRVPAAEQGISEVTVSLYRTFAQPLDDEALFGWHRMLFGARAGVAEVGMYRTQPEPIRVISGGLGAEKLHFEAPPSSRMGEEMARFIAWFNRTAPTGPAPMPPITRAGIAHLYFVSVHPFEDGNGRIGRAISEKALAQSVGQPAFTGLATTILERRKSYYEALEAASYGNEITPWLTWFAETTLQARERTTAMVEFLISKTRLFDSLRGQLFVRQERALRRMFREGPDGFRGGLSASNYMKITGASPATATRDLADLVAIGALVRTRELRHARYHLKLSGSKVDRGGEPGVIG